MERATSFEQLSGVLGLVTHTFCPIARILTKIMLTYAGHNGKVYGYQEEVVRFSPNEFRFYGLIKTMFFYDIF